MSNIYAAPEAELIPAPSTDGYGSVDRAVTGDYRLDIREVINEAWKKTRGVKGTMLLACGLCYLVYFAVMWTALFLFSAIGLTSIPAIIPLIQTPVVTGAMMPIAMGLFILGLRRTMDAPLSLTSIMRHYDKTIHLVITFMWFYVIMYAIRFIGSILLIVPALGVLGFVLPIVSVIYLAVTYCMALPLVVEKGLRPWQALEISRKAISQRWFAVFRFLMLIGLINCVGAQFFGVGLIWTLPFSWIAFGILYRNMFGCEAATLSG